jgi:hypothetical protein
MRHVYPGSGHSTIETKTIKNGTYQIKVPGHLDESWTEWDGRMTVAVVIESDGRPVTTLTGTVDQAALQGLLRRLYSLGLPLISVNLVEGG